MSTKLLTWVRKNPVAAGWVLEGDRKTPVSAAVRNGLRHRLADHANDDGVCRLSMYVLATETGWSYRTVRRGLESLEKEGEIERQRRYGKRGYRVADEIRLVATVTRPSGHCGQALETLSSTKRRGTPGACHTQEGNSMTFGRDPQFDSPPEGYDGPMPTELDLREEKMKIKEAQASKRPDSAPALAFDFRRKASKLQPHITNPVNVMAVTGEINKMMTKGATAREIRLAIKLLCRDVRGKKLPHPLGQLFIKQQDKWLQAARDHIYEKEELPRLQQENVELWKIIEQDAAVWRAAHPDASYDEQVAYIGALYRNLAAC